MKVGQKAKDAAPSLPSAPSINLPSVGFNTSLLTLPRKSPVLIHAFYQFWCLGRMWTACVEFADRRPQSEMLLLTSYAVAIGGIGVGTLLWKQIDPGFSAFFDDALAKVPTAAHLHKHVVRCHRRISAGDPLVQMVTNPIAPVQNNNKIGAGYEVAIGSGQNMRGGSRSSSRAPAKKVPVRPS